MRFRSVRLVEMDVEDVVIIGIFHGRCERILKLVLGMNVETDAVVQNPGYTAVFPG